MSFLSILLNGYNQINLEDVELPQRNIFNLKGTGVTASDNPTTGATDITITSGTGSALTALTADVIATGPGVASAEVQGIRGRTVASTTPSDAAVLVYDSPTSTWNPRLIHGDATLDSTGLLTVVGIQGYPVSTDAPLSGDVLAWNTLGFWEPNSAAGGGISQLTGDITAGPGTGSQVAAIAAGVIVDADVNASAAIAGTKIAPAFGGQNITATGYLGIGSATLPATGTIRLDGAVPAWIKFISGGTDYPLVDFASSVVSIGTTAHYTDYGGYEVRLRPGGGAVVRSNAPINGDSSAWGSVNSTATQAMGDANQTLAASKYEATRLITTGAITADRTAVYPVATDAQGYRKVITNNCTSGGPYGLIVASGANPATVLVGLAKTCEVWIDSNGVTRLTADI
jgi:hypothetical protein